MSIQHFDEEIREDIQFLTRAEFATRLTTLPENCSLCFHIAVDGVYRRAAKLDIVPVSSWVEVGRAKATQLIDSTLAPGREARGMRIGCQLIRGFSGWTLWVGGSNVN